MSPQAVAPSRDPVIDLARAVGVVVVVLWHWTLSVTFRTADGGLVMANPIHTVPGGWLLTWAGQVMPVFFLVGGYVNWLSWERARAQGRTAGQFVGARLRRLLAPALVWAVAWLGAETLTAAVADEHRWMWQWFPGYLAPLWFLGVYVVLVSAVPVTASWHRRHGPTALGALVVLLAVASVLDRAAGLGEAAWVTAGLVWVFCHQLGYAWCTAQLGWRPLAQRLAVTGVGVGALAGLTTAGGYPRSMVSTASDVESNLLPTTVAIAALAVVQVGLLATATPALHRLLRRPRIAQPVLALNTVALTVFLWHMSAYLAVLGVYEGLGGVLLDEPSPRWWAQRWMWLGAPLLVLAVLVALFARVEAAFRGEPRARRLSGGAGPATVVRYGRAQDRR